MPSDSIAQASESQVRRMSLSREGRIWLLAFAALWITGWVKGINLILLLAYLILALWALNWWVAWRALRGLGAKRIPSGPVFAGETAPRHVEVCGNGSRRLAALDLLDEGAAHSASWFVMNLQPGECVRLRGEQQFAQRGYYESRPLRAASAYPFGLVRQEVDFGVAGHTLVYPALGTLNIERMRRWLLYASRPDERSRRTRRRLANEVEFHGLRSFRPGDSPRWIHWRTSARRGELMVREFDQGTHFDLLLLVDAFESAPAQQAALEQAFSLAATIAWEWSHEAGDHIVLGVAGEEATVTQGGSGAFPSEAILGALATARGSPAPDMQGLVKKLEQTHLPTGPALLVSSRASVSADADLVSRRLHRPVGWMNAAEPPEFYVPPTAHAAAS